MRIAFVRPLVPSERWQDSQEEERHHEPDPHGDGHGLPAPVQDPDQGPEHSAEQDDRDQAADDRVRERSGTDAPRSIVLEVPDPPEERSRDASSSAMIDWKYCGGTLIRSTQHGVG